MRFCFSIGASSEQSCFSTNRSALRPCSEIEGHEIFYSDDTSASKVRLVPDFLQLNCGRTDFSRFLASQSRTATYHPQGSHSTRSTLFKFVFPRHRGRQRNSSFPARHRNRLSNLPRPELSRTTDQPRRLVEWIRAQCGR